MVILYYIILLILLLSSSFCKCRLLAELVGGYIISANPCYFLFRSLSSFTFFPRTCRRVGDMDLMFNLHTSIGIDHRAQEGGSICCTPSVSETSTYSVLVYLE